MKQEFTVTEKDAGQRLDVFCVGKLSQFSRGQIQAAIKTGDILVNEEAKKPKYAVKEGDEVVVGDDILIRTSQPSPEATAGKAPLVVIYEDKDVKVINKPAGIDAEYIAGRAHRLDKDTTGVMILAKSEEALEKIQEQFKKRYVQKEYLALVFGVPGESDGRIVQPLLRSKRNPMRRAVDKDGKIAVTEWTKEQAYNKQYALLRVFPQTGRTHQIRVHLHWLGFPIVGDSLYTFKRKSLPAGVMRQMLHAEVLTLTLPSGDKKTFTAPLPKDFQEVLDQLK